MANVDTGLGWSAAQNYLTAQPGRIGTMSGIGGASFPGQPLPVLTGGSDAINSPFYWDQYGSTGSVEWQKTYIGAVDSTLILAFCHGNSLVFCSTVQNSHGVEYCYNTVKQQFVRSQQHQLSQYDSSSGLWYRAVSHTYISTTSPNTIPVFPSRAEGFAAVRQYSQDYYKLNPGYSVVGFCKWIDLGNETVTAPFIISSNPEYTPISLDGTTDAGATTLGMRWQNMSFTLALLLHQEGGVSNNAMPVIDITTAFPGPTTVSVLFEALLRATNVIVGSTPDPYGGDAQPGGGEGNPDEDEEIDFSTPPTVGSYVGFFRMWNPTEAELRQLASWMWSSAFDLDTFKRIFSAPIDAILGLSLVPVQPAGIGGYTIVLGGIDTQISAFTVTNRYVALNCGSLTVDERWGAYLDYAPYTKMSIFLPYIGFRDISTDDVMGKTVELQYTVDVLSGACVAELKCGGSVLYSWQGNCAQQLPITSADWSNALSAALGLAGTAATAIVTGGGSLPLAGTVASATVNALSLKPRMERGGSISGAAGAMAGQVPYLVRERPEQAVPGRQNHFIGYPSFTTVTLGSIAGYTEVESIHLEGIPATAAELSELESILKEGFIL